MEREDLEIIDEWKGQDPELKRYLDEHEEYERQLEEFNRRPYLTTAESVDGSESMTSKRSELWRSRPMRASTWGATDEGLPL